MRDFARPFSRLQDFYSFMFDIRTVKKRIVTALLENVPPSQHDIDCCRAATSTLRKVCNSTTQALLDLDENRKTTIDCTYEITEMEKDLRYLEEGDEPFFRYLATIHPRFEEQIEKGMTVIGKQRLKNVISDRDGTVNNYCARYLSSIQSVYNAVWIANFAREATENCVILTSAPLDKKGLVDISTMPGEHFILAGSKGREYQDKRGVRNSFAIAPAQQKKLDELNGELTSLLASDTFEKFSLIGSGFQQKFGQTTIARQDINTSISPEESTRFLQTLQELVARIDPDHAFFRIEDTSLDVEIILTVQNEGDAHGLKDFDKGDGIRFLDQECGLDLAAGPNLICGDTSSDVPMITAAMAKNADTKTVFVTTGESLMEQVRTACPGHCIVDTPDVLVGLLWKLSL